MELEAVSKMYTTEKIETHALAKIHLRIEAGEFVTIAGPSGCGKSTLLAILGLLDVPSTGDYRLRGRSLANGSAKARARIRNRDIGFIFQSFNLIGELDVFDNVALPLRYARTPRAMIKARVQAALERVGLGHRAQHRPSQLSGGQQQRVAVARAIIGSPQIILADEPTGNLDSENGRMVLELLRDLNRSGSTICMVTHDHRHARYATREIRLLDGRIVDESRGLN